MTVLWSTIKRSGKTSIGSLRALWCALFVTPSGVVVLISSTLDASKNKSLQFIKMVIAMHPVLEAEVVRETSTEIWFRNGNVIRSVPVNAGALAGMDIIHVLTDEGWSLDQEMYQRAHDELRPIHSREFSEEWQTSYAGFHSEPGVLKPIWDLALKGKRVHEDLPLYWNEEARVFGYIDQGVEARRFPWQQDDSYYRAQELQLRKVAFQRLHLNFWANAVESFLTAEMLDSVEDSNHRPPLPGQDIALFVGLDASVRRDFTALVSVYWEAGQLMLGPMKVWKPTAAEPVDFDAVEDEVRRWNESYRLVTVEFDPYQLAATAQRLETTSVPMNELPQISSNLSEAASTLLDAIQHRRLTLWPCEDLRSALLNAVLVESSRGIKIAKEKTSKKIDAAAALSFAVLAATREGPFAASDWEAFGVGQELESSKALRGL